MNSMQRNVSLICGLLWLIAPSAFAQSPVPAAPSVGATSYVLVDFHSDTVIAEQEADARVEPASITKLMTSYVAFSEIAAATWRSTTRC
jgi:serine-type D-Ala-D-Ala carboxypeptidase (penicillin-binding protein 5/6)